MCSYVPEELIYGYMTEKKQQQDGDAEKKNIYIYN